MTDPRSMREEEKRARLEKVKQKEEEAQREKEVWSLGVLVVHLAP
jgi:hypothetical protein